MPITAPEGIKKPSLLSETPTSVLIVWTEPEFPNGEITSYTIERRIKVKMFFVREFDFLFQEIFIFDNRFNFKCLYFVICPLRVRLLLTPLQACWPISQNSTWMVRQKSGRSPHMNTESLRRLLLATGTVIGMKSQQDHQVRIVMK